MKTDRLVTTEIMNGDFYISLPDGFHTMSEQIAQAKYPAQNRPQLILTNDLTNVDYKFTYINEVVSTDALEYLLKQTKIGLKRIFTGIEYYEENTIQVNNTRLGWFDYVSPAIGGKLYNISFFTWIKNKLLQGTFTCEYIDACEWRECFLQSIMSIKEERTNEQW